MALKPTRAPHCLCSKPWHGARASALAVAIASLCAFSQNANALDASVCAWRPTLPNAAAQPVSPDNALLKMAAQVLDCQKDAQFLAAFGQLLNSQGRYVEAADHLERALLLEPDLKDAQLSYAIALAGSGDLSSARAMIDNLLSDPGLPEALRPLIASQKTLLMGSNGTRDSPAFQSRVTLATRIGYDSNLLGSPNLRSLALTLPDQIIVLPLDENYLARPAAYARADLQLEVSRVTPQGVRWDALASLRSRASPSIHIAGNSQIDLSVERSDFTARTTLFPLDLTAFGFAPVPVDKTPAKSDHSKLNGASNPSMSAGSYLNASTSALKSNAGTRFQAWGLGAGWGGTWQNNAMSNCQARAGLEWQARDYLDNNVLSGRYKGLSLNWSCDYTSGVQLTAGLKAGTDHPADTARPGGTQNQTSLKAAAFLPQALLAWSLAPTNAPARTPSTRNGFLVDLEYSQLRDTSGYSPIIDSGRSRSVTRFAARLEYQYFMSDTLKLFLGTEWVGQTSNIALFGSNSKGAYSGLRRSW